MAAMILASLTTPIPLKAGTLPFIIKKECNEIVTQCLDVVLECQKFKDELVIENERLMEEAICEEKLGTLKWVPIVSELARLFTCVI